MAAPMNKIAVIGGGGMVGAATTYALLARNVAAEIFVVDIIEMAARGQALDIADAAATLSGSVKKGSYKDAGECDLVIITAGYPQKPGEPRSALLGKNKEIMKSIMEAMAPINPKMKILVVANPVDVLTHLAQKLSGLPKNQVFGSGTYLDSCRLRGTLAGIIGVHMNDIQAYVLGEHGDRQFVAWSSATVGGMPLLKHPEVAKVNRDEIREATMKKAYEIIEAKKSTYFGIGMCTAVIAEACLSNQNHIFPLVSYNDEHGTYMSWPVTIGRDGTGQTFNVQLDSSEQKSFEVAVKAIKEMCAEADVL